MGKSKKKSLIDKVLHPGSESSDAGEHELEGEGSDEHDQDEIHELAGESTESDGAITLPADDKHQHKKFDKFKRGN